jgi:hypothetical protein
MECLRRRIVAKLLARLTPLAILLIVTDAVSFAGTMTPLLIAAQNAPIPFLGSDNQTHLVYELQVTNFSSGQALVQAVKVVGDGKVLASLDSVTIADRLQPAGRRDTSATMAPSEQALLFLHVALPADAPIPRRLVHGISAYLDAAPPGRQEVSENGGETPVGQAEVVVIGPPLRGERFISADSCCDSSRHTRAALPVNGQVFLAQRFAVDWEQLNPEGHIYTGGQSDLASYTIYGHEVLAVADAVVVAVIDGLPNQPPGKMPSNIAIEEADGNSIVLDLGSGRYAL